MTNEASIDLGPYIADLAHLDPIRSRGLVTDVTGFLIESQGPAARVGSFCEIRTAQDRIIRTQVTGFRNGRILSIPLEDISGIQPGDSIYARPQDAQVGVGPGPFSQVIARERHNRGQ